MTTKQRLEAMKRAAAKPCTFKLLDRQREAMQHIAQQTGTALSEQIRRGVDLWLKQQEMSK